MTRSLLLAAGAGLALSGCGLLAPPVAMPPQTLPQAQAPAAWYAPLPAAAPQPSAPAVAETARAAALRQWWQQFDDPVLVALIDAGQAASPTIAAAASRIEQARAASTAADAALIPFVNAQGGASVASRNLIQPGMTNASLSVQAGWEIDLFGAGRARADAAAARLEASEAGWHDARIAVAAETGSTYNTLRGCEALVVQTEADVRSREETARVTTLAVQAGMMAPASGALARASAAQGRSLLAAQRAQCEQLVKALVALTALDEPALRARLAPGHARQPLPATIEVERVPGQALAQRPDLAAAERQVLAAADDTVRAQAQRYPRIAIAGSVGPALLRVQDNSTSGNLWTIGPLQITLPLFNGGTLVANVVAARARYDEALSAYRAAVRGAVREVESALVSLDSSARREADLAVAIEGFEASLQATDARFRGGLGSLFDLEEARRSLLVARSSQVDLQRERVAAWIALYRALGGGWTPADDLPVAAAKPAGNPPP
ncbi:MAG TPA: efflux transporter outer membrane subunit [Rubrivivax sp.]|nr:efflux transporter outer membrane subunit [Rubrivivax sp.]